MAAAHRRVALLLAGLAAAPAAGLRVGQQPLDDVATRSRISDEERAARAAGTCGKGVLPVDLAQLSREPGGQAVECDKLIPRYDMVEWQAKHGRKVPDHPAVFVNTQTHESQVFPTKEAFLELHGDETVVAIPEYAQSGSSLKNPGALGRVNASFRDLARTWGETFVYFSDFNCKPGSLCDKAARQFGAPELFATRSFHSKNFLVGGADSGLPFHKHGMTWQGLSMGRKAWYVLPPGSMSEKMHDETGPYIFPMRSYHGLMADREVGERPLYCVQHPGEVFYVPDSWWHATMNLDEFQVAYGEKPSDKAQTSPMSPALAAMLKVYPRQAFDTAGYTAGVGGGILGFDSPMPYSLQARVQRATHTCGAGVDTVEYGFDEPLRRMRALAANHSRVMTCGAAETAAFAHCHMAIWAEQLRHHETDCKLSRTVLRFLRNSARFWVDEAAKISPQLAARENGICHKPPALKDDD